MHRELLYIPHLLHPTCRLHMACLGGEREMHIQFTIVQGDMISRSYRTHTHIYARTHATPTVKGKRKKEKKERAPIPLLLSMNTSHTQAHFPLAYCAATAIAWNGMVVVVVVLLLS